MLLGRAQSKGAVSESLCFELLEIQFTGWLDVCLKNSLHVFEHTLIFTGVLQRNTVARYNQLIVSYVCVACRKENADVSRHAR
jgi:hypothetical protein